MVVLLQNGTTGSIDDADDIDVGMTVTIKAKDENGNFIEVTGVVQEVLIDGEY